MSEQDQQQWRRAEFVERVNYFFKHDTDWYPISEWPDAMRNYIYSENAGGNIGRYNLFMFFVLNGVYPPMASHWIKQNRRLDSDAHRQLNYLEGHWHKYTNRHTYWDMERREYR